LWQDEIRALVPGADHGKVRDMAEAAFDLAALVAQRPPRAAGFIVTLYGDAVVPRGGELGMAAIIETCAMVGISETLVRTAVSRLVAAGQLAGHRQGRRSFYRLTPGAAAEFAAASAVIYGPPVAAGWRLLIGPDAALEGPGLARLRPGVALGPARGPVPEGTAALEGAFAGAAGCLANLAAELWDLPAHASALAALRDRFGPLVARAAALNGEAALALRLLLVHDWRRAALADPRLPPEALPPDWPGPSARAVFARLYSALTPAAERRIAARFDCVAGPLPRATSASRARLAALDVSRKDANDRLICDAFAAIR